MTLPESIRTKRLHGERVRPADLAYLIGSDGDIRIQRWLGGAVQSPEKSRERLERWMAMWETSGMGFWIFRDAEGEVVGHGGLFLSPRERGEIEVGYAIVPERWGGGLATEITQACIATGFAHGVERIIAIAQSANAASRRVLEKSGLLLEREGVSPDGVASVRYAIQRDLKVTAG